MASLNIITTFNLDSKNFTSTINPPLQNYDNSLSVAVAVDQQTHEIYYMTDNSIWIMQILPQQQFNNWFPIVSVVVGDVFGYTEAGTANLLVTNDTMYL